MGTLSRDSIVTAGLQKAGKTNLTSLANTWLAAWLRTRAAEWSWPQLQRRASGIALSAGATSLSVGAGSNGITPEIHRLHDPIFISDGTYATRAYARIRQLVGQYNINDESLRPSTERGLPVEFKVRRDSATPGRFTLVPYPYPDKAYVISFDWQELPADPSGATVPWYPSDRTMIQAVMVDALQYMDKRRDYQLELEVLASMVSDDRNKFGTDPGFNDNWGLDPKVFR
jgi:hypothetical protein